MISQIVKRSVLIILIQLFGLVAYYVGVTASGVNPVIFEIDINYMLSASWSELRQFFPNYYWAIYVVGRSIPLVLISIAMYTIVISRSWLDAQIMNLWRSNSMRVEQLFVPFCIGLLFSLLVYFSSNLAYGQQLLLARCFVGTAVLDFLLVLLVNRNQTLKILDSFLFKPELPHTLAIIRILFFTLSGLLSLLYYMPQFGPNMGALEKVALPYMGWFISIVPVGPELYRISCILAAISAFIVAVGFRTRFFLVVHAILVFYVVATPHFFGKLSHNQLFIWISWVMAFSPCYDVLSIDSLRAKPKNLLESGKYAFHLRVIWLHFGHIYFFAGFYKLWVCGFDWAFTNSMVNQVQIEWFEHFDRIPKLRLDTFPWFLKIGGMAVIIFEMVYAFLLFDKRWRWLSIIGALIMHNVLNAIMYIGFVLLLQTFYLVYVPWNWVLKKLKLVSLKVELESFSLRGKWKSLVYAGPLFILSANLMSGALNVNSYPFSVYPIYAEIVPDNVRYFEYRVNDAGLEDIDVREEGKKHHFRWEHYSRTEYHIIRMHLAGSGLDTAGVRTLWKRWQLEIPTLKDIQSVDVYIVERPIDPLRADERVMEEYLLTIE